MSLSRSYWVGSNVPYIDYLANRDSALAAAEKELLKTAKTPAQTAALELTVGDSVHFAGGKTAQILSSQGDGWEPTYNLIVADGVRVHSHTTLRTLRTFLWDLLGERMAGLEQSVITGCESLSSGLSRLRIRALADRLS